MTTVAIRGHIVNTRDTKKKKKGNRDLKPHEQKDQRGGTEQVIYA